MTQEELLQKRNNDLFAQYLRACRVESLEEKAKRREEVSKCQHEFVMLKPAEYHGACHSSDCETIDPVIECVHCGLTNKFIDVFFTMVRIGTAIHTITGNYILKGTFSNAKPFENELFRELVDLKDILLFGTDKRPLYEFNSENIIASNHIGLLYNIAKQLYPDASAEELVKVMRELHLLETSVEYLKLETLENASELIERYKLQFHLSREKK